MKLIHQQEKQQFKKLFQQENIDGFDDRFKILETFLNNEQHVTENELLKYLNENGHQYDLEFVRDTLDLMCRFGFAQTVRFNNGEVRYEHRHLGQHHDHMICTKCRKIIEFKNEELENLQEQISTAYGFMMLQHKMEIYGICSDCLQESITLMPLSMAKQGERLIIKDMSGGSVSRMRLMSMGLRIGDQVEVITNSGQGQIVVAVDYNRFAIGRGLSKKIHVERIK